jgi:hypothetical protein
VFDLARAIDGCLDGFAFNSSESGYPSLQDKWKPQKKGVCYWHALPFYTTYFRWIKCKNAVHLDKKSKHLNLSDRILCLEVVADDVGSSAEEWDPETFGPPESSAALLRCFFGKPLKERDGVSIEDAKDVEVEEPLVVTRSDDGNFVLWWEDIDMVTLPTKADVVRAIGAFVAKAEIALKGA